MAALCPRVSRGALGAGAALWLLALLVAGGCGGDAGEEAVPCPCTVEGCEEASVCPVVLELPGACFEDELDATFSLGPEGLEVALAADASENVCEGVMAATRLPLIVSGIPGWPADRHAYCASVGARAEIDLCTVEFVVEADCTGTAAETWSVDVEGVRGEPSVDVPFRPCLFLTPGDSLGFTARAAGLLTNGEIRGCGQAGGVLTTRLSCSGG